MTTVSRRQFVTGSAAAALAAATPAAPALAQNRSRPARRSQTNQIALECAFKDMVLDGTKVRLRAYNNQIPGPLLRIHPGQTVRIRLKNALPHYDSSRWNGNHNVPHALGTTNLHVHGMDVIPHLFEPLGTTNPLAPMIAIRPGQVKDYVFEIPKDHPPGLDWYHPHHHGSTVVQAVSGMAGGIIVHGAIDEVPEIKAARDIPLVMQDIGLFPSEDIPGLWTYLPRQNAIWQTFTGQVTMYDPATQTPVPTDLKGGFTTGDYALRYYLLNGQPFFKEVHNPVGPPNRQPAPTATQLGVTRIQMAPGEVVRFRMLNGNSDNLMPIVVEEHEMHLIALDGVNFPELRTVPVTPIDTNPDNLGQVLLAPANRAEFLIKALSTPGIYRVVQLQQAQQFLFSAQKTIAEIEVIGSARHMALPDKLPLPSREYPLIKDSEIENHRIVQFSGNVPGVLNPVVGIDFLINNTQYQETAVPTVVTLGDAEEWQLVVEGPHHGGTEGHPFHIHVNSFEVVSVGGKLVAPGTIKDTIWVAAKSTVVIRIRFKQWTGKSVYHCHILPHEDTGMMQNFLILPKSKTSPH